MNSLHDECESRATRIIYVPVNKNENLFKPVLVYCDNKDTGAPSRVHSVKIGG